MKVKLDDIIEAIEFTDQYTHYFLDQTTGEIVMVSEMGMTSSEQERRITFSTNTVSTGCQHPTICRNMMSWNPL